MRTSLTYKKAFEIADVAVKGLEKRGWNFREGVQRAAALAAMAQRSDSAIVEAIEDVLEQHRTAIDATGWAEAAFAPTITLNEWFAKVALHHDRIVRVHG